MARELAQFAQVRMPIRPPFESLEDAEKYADAFQAAMADYLRTLVNALARYSTGRWTPIDSSGASLSFTDAVGTWVKIGELVIATCAVVYPANASGANAVIGGLPYPINAFNSPTVIYTTDPTGTTLAFGVASSTVCALVLGAGGAARTNAQMSTDTVVFTLVYETI